MAGVKTLKTENKSCLNSLGKGSSMIVSTLLSIIKPRPVAVSRSGENLFLLAVLEVEYCAVCGSRTRPPGEKTRGRAPRITDDHSHPSSSQRSTSLGQFGVHGIVAFSTATSKMSGQSLFHSHVESTPSKASLGDLWVNVKQFGSEILPRAYFNRTTMYNNVHYFNLILYKSI